MSRMLNDLAALNQLSDVVSLQEMMARRPLSYRDFGDDTTDILTSITTGLSTLATGAANVYTAVAGQPKPAATAPIVVPQKDNTMLYLGIGAAVLILGGGFILSRRRR